MTPLVANLLVLAALGTAIAAIAYLVIAVSCVWRFRQRLAAPLTTEHQPPITLLKPIHGHDPELEDNLRSCYNQDYSQFQIIFCVDSEADPALPSVRRVMAEFPHIEAALVISDTKIGTNPKISNLANAVNLIEHDLIVIADSDMRVESNYLQQIAAPFADEQVGAVTCLYSGSAVSGYPSRLGAMFVNEWFLPSVLVAYSMQELKFCFGATMAVRREILESGGGLAALADCLADDYMLGQMVIEQGYRVALANYVVENIIYEPDLRTLMLHELRWARTMRTVQPVGYALALVTDAIPVSLAACALTYALNGPVLVANIIFGLALLGRFALHSLVNSSFPIRKGRALLSIIPRDLLTSGVRLASFLPGGVHWRGQNFKLSSQGNLLMCARSDDRASAVNAAANNYGRGKPAVPTDNGREPI